MMYEEVKKQHKHFGLLYSGPARSLDIDEKYFYLDAMREEIEEYEASVDLEDEYDALLDLMVFAIGAMLRHGFSPDGIKEVVRANMQKELGPIDGKRQEFELDLRKPSGWTAPDLKKFL